MCRKENRPGTGNRIFSGLSPELLKVVSLGTKPLTQSPIGMFSYSNSDFGKVFVFYLFFLFFFFGGGWELCFQEFYDTSQGQKEQNLNKGLSQYLCV